MIYFPSSAPAVLLLVLWGIVACGDVAVVDDPATTTPATSDVVVDAGGEGAADAAPATSDVVVDAGGEGAADAAPLDVWGQSCPGAWAVVDGVREWLCY